MGTGVPIINEVDGVIGGVPGGTDTSPGGAITTASSPGSPQQLLQQRWRPPSLLDFHTQLNSNPLQASRNLDAAVQRAFMNTYTLESMIASTQFGSATITGKTLAIPTGLTTIKQCTGSIDNGATAHNFWVSVVKSQTPGAIDIYVWKPTAAGDNTPIAATTAVLVRWSATGTLSVGS